MGLNDILKSSSSMFNANVRIPLVHLNVLDKVENTHIQHAVRKHATDDRHLSNVKANMTSWYLHEESDVIGGLADLVLIECQKMSGQFDLVMGECWGNVQRYSENVVEHTHWPFLWSWCYYSLVDSTSPPLIFPEAKQSFEPEIGDLIIFPSYIKHSVPHSYSENERIVIAGNIAFKFRKPTMPPIDGFAEAVLCGANPNDIGC